ncbi:MAG: integration host factor subunit beta [Duodenibacillus sp.]|nr:integration host factor subunit beta [Duodenibacillus sp.]
MPNALVKSQLAEELYIRHDFLTRSDAAGAVDVILRLAGAALSRGTKIEIRGFGTFHLVHRGARMGRNPRTGQVVRVKPKFAVHFKMGKMLKETLKKREP